MGAQQTRPLVVISPLHRAIRQLGIHLDLESRGLGLTASDSHLMAFVAAHGPCSVGELRKVFGHRASTTTSLLDRLENEGLLKRKAHPRDRRSFHVEATARGRKLGRRARAMVEELEAVILSEVSPRDLAGFQKVLEAIALATGIDVRNVPRSEETDR